MTSKIRNINKYTFNKQMALPLTFKTIKNRENFIISKCNEEAVRFIENSSFWQNKRKINSIPAAIIFGPKGSGKTHSHIKMVQFYFCQIYHLQRWIGNLMI